jgi:hypothetical protein
MFEVYDCTNIYAQQLLKRFLFALLQRQQWGSEWISRRVVDLLFLFFLYKYVSLNILKHLCIIT